MYSGLNPAGFDRLFARLLRRCRFRNDCQWYDG